MTYNVNIMGYGDEPYEEREEVEANLLARLVDALEQDGGTVMQFNFQGNEVKAESFEAAQEFVADHFG